MGNTLVYKFKGIDELLHHKVPCTAHLNSNNGFKIYSKQLITLDQECPQSSPYHATAKYNVSRMDIEWVEYCVRNDGDPGVVERYSQILMDSSISPYLEWKELPDGTRTASYRFDLSIPYRKMLFILSLMRYLEEYPEDVIAVLDYPEASYLTPDQILMTISLRLSWSNHAVFKPFNKMYGGYELCDNLISAILSEEGKAIRDVSEYSYNTGPQSFFEKLTDHRRNESLPSKEVGEMINWLRGD